MACFLFSSSKLRVFLSWSGSWAVVSPVNGTASLPRYRVPRAFIRTAFSCAILSAPPWARTARSTTACGSSAAAARPASPRNKPATAARSIPFRMIASLSLRRGEDAILELVEELHADRLALQDLLAVAVQDGLHWQLDTVREQ